MKLNSLLFSIMATLIISGCASTQVVLLESEKAHNAIIVSTKAGSVVIDKPYEATALNSNNSVPGAIQKVSKEEFINAHKDTFGVQLQKPVSFMLYFENDSTQIVKKSKAEFNDVLKSLISRQPCYVDIIGHADTTGTQEYNMKLSLKRTEVVKKMIESNKIVTSKINLEYYGENVPLVKTEDGKSNSKNRRVEIMIR